MVRCRESERTKYNGKNHHFSLFDFHIHILVSTVSISLKFIPIKPYFTALNGMTLTKCTIERDLLKSSGISFIYILSFYVAVYFFVCCCTSYFIFLQTSHFLFILFVFVDVAVCMLYFFCISFHFFFILFSCTHIQSVSLRLLVNHYNHFWFKDFSSFFFFCFFSHQQDFFFLFIHSSLHRWIVYRTNSWGYLKNGTFDGMIGALVRKEIDIGGSPIFFRLERAKVIDYTARTWISR